MERAGLAPAVLLHCHSVTRPAPLRSSCIAPGRIRQRCSTQRAPYRWARRRLSATSWLPPLGELANTSSLWFFRAAGVLGSPVTGMPLGPRRIDALAKSFSGATGKLGARACFRVKERYVLLQR